MLSQSTTFDYISFAGCKVPEIIVETVTETVTETVVETVEVDMEEEDFTPYYLTDDFEPYVELAKKEIFRPDDERTVAPVDRVPTETVKIGYLGGQTNPFFDAVFAGVEAAKIELAPHNVVLDWIIPGATFGSGDYGEAIETLVTKEYDGICTMIFNEGFIPFVNSAVDQGVPIASMIVNSDEPNKALFFIGQDLYQGGVTAAHALAEEIGGEGKVVIITGFFALSGHELRRTGLTFPSLITCLVVCILYSLLKVLLPIFFTSKFILLLSSLWCQYLGGSPFRKGYKEDITRQTLFQETRQRCIL